MKIVLATDQSVVSHNNVTNIDILLNKDIYHLYEYEGKLVLYVSAVERLKLNVEHEDNNANNMIRLTQEPKID